MIPFRDRFGRFCPVYARVENNRAGHKVIIYAKNILLCHTEQRLDFYYQNKPDLFSEGTDHEFPLPVTDNRTELETD